jgi:hypothetical protein
MKSYKITIEVKDVGGIYDAENIEEASKIAEKICNEIYVRLRGNCTVKVKNIEELLNR